MRSLSGSPDPALHPLALILAAVAPAAWGLAGLALGLTLLVRGVLVLALSAALSLVLACYLAGYFEVALAGMAREFDKKVLQGSTA